MDFRQNAGGTRIYARPARCILYRATGFPSRHSHSPDQYISASQPKFSAISSCLFVGKLQYFLKMRIFFDGLAAQHQFGFVHYFESGEKCDAFCRKHGLFRRRQGPQRAEEIPVAQKQSRVRDLFVDDRRFDVEHLQIVADVDDKLPFALFQFSGEFIRIHDGHVAVDFGVRDRKGNGMAVGAFELIVDEAHIRAAVRAFHDKVRHGVFS